MLVQKSNLLQRVRVVMIALVAVIGFGTMAMKPDVRAAHTYGIAKTANGLNWVVVDEVTPSTAYSCNTASSICKVHSSDVLNPGDPITVDPLSPDNTPGRFELE